MTMTGSIIPESQHIPIHDNNNNRVGQACSVAVESSESRLRFDADRQNDSLKR
jgi:hypothetical protein